MRHPFRMYCFALAEKLGKHISEIMELDSKVIAEWMAYDLANSEDWRNKYLEEQEKERQKNMSNEEKAKLFRQLLGGGNNGNNC